MTPLIAAAPEDIIHATVTKAFESSANAVKVRSSGRHLNTRICR
jgi:hypothetical protein